MSKDDEEWKNAPNMRGLDFLDTIPEDTPVAVDRDAALSTASAVAFPQITEKKDPLDEGDGEPLRVRWGSL
jgi:hypothetical protein